MSSMAYAGAMPFAAEATASERVEFIRKTYVHLGLAVLAFIGMEAYMLNTPLAAQLTNLMLGGKYNYLIFMGLFMLVSWMAETWARSSTSQTTQYLGLGVYVGLQSILFVPLLFIAQSHFGSEIIVTAAIVTLSIFGALTAFVMITGMDFAFMRMVLMVVGIGVFALCLCSAIFGFTLPLAFTIGMIVFACGYILYDTSNVLHHYHTDQYVSASLALFASVALLFWYVLRLLMSLKRD